MGATRSGRQVKGLPLIAAVCLTTALALGQDQAKPARQLEWVAAKWQSVNSVAAGPLTFTCPGGGTCWVGGASGAWSNSANWSNGVPTSSTNALIDNHNANGQGVSAVTLDIGGAHVLNLTVDSDDSLSFNDSTNLTVNGSSISNAGHMALNSAGNPTELIIGSSAVTLSGGGTLTLGNNPNNFILGSTGSNTLTNQETIQGSGNIGDGQMGLVNNGTIIANQSDALFVDASSKGFANNGTLQTASGSTMHAEGGPFTNFSGGTLKGGTYNVSGTLEIDQLGSSGGEIVTNAATIILNGTRSSFVDAASNNALSNLNTNAAAGIFTITGGRNFTTAGSFTNNGSLTVGGGSTFKVPTGFSLKNFSGTTLTGGAYAITGTLQFPGANIVTNAASITLSGTSSRIVDQNGANGLANFATNDSAGSFTINSGRNFTTAGDFTNNGTLTVGSSTSKFAVNGNLTNFDSTTGTLIDGTYNLTGTLQFNGANITSTDGAAITLSGTSSQIVDQTGASGLANFALNDTGSRFTINSGRNFTTGGDFTNNGTLAVGSNNSTFDVNGNLTNFDSASGNLTGGTYNVTGTLQFNGANIVTNAAIITLTGTSSRIIDQSGNNGLANFATNAIGAGFAVAGGRVFTTSGAFTNNGSLMTTGRGSQFTTSGSARFTNNGTLTTTGGDSETATGASGSFTNNGTLTVGSGSTFSTGGSLSNFSGTTLTGGAYNVSGTFQFPGANIVTNAASITLTGASSKIINSTNGANGLANFATNTSTGVLSLQGGRSLTTSGAFSNAGSLIIGGGATFTVGGTGMFTQTAGTTADDGTLRLTSSGTLNLQAGSLFGNGTITGAVTSSGTVAPGDILKPRQTGILGETGAYTQHSAGTLNIAIEGTMAGTQYDQLNPTTATLNGTLNINRYGFVPSIGSTFKIMNFNSESGQFSTVNGLAINSSEHFTITYQPNDVLLTVVSGPCCGPLSKFSTLSTAGSSYAAAEPGWLGFGGVRAGRMPVRGRLQGAPLHGVIGAWDLASTEFVMRQNAPSRIGAFAPTRNFSPAAAAHGFISAGAAGANRINATGALLRNNCHRPRMMAPKSLEYHLDVLSFLATGPRQALRGLWTQPGNSRPASVGYLTFSGSH